MRQDAPKDPTVDGGTLHLQAIRDLPYRQEMLHHKGTSPLGNRLLRQRHEKAEPEELVRIPAGSWSRPGKTMETVPLPPWFSVVFYWFYMAFHGFPWVLLAFPGDSQRNYGKSPNPVQAPTGKHRRCSHS
jgi:hypothetical protein